MNTTVSSFIFGITIAISVGPIAMLIINRSINCGLRTGILTGLAAASADFTYAIISFVAGSAVYALLIENELWLQSASSLILMLYGGWMLLNAFRNRNSAAQETNSPCKGVFASTYALTMANPLTIIAFSGFAAQSAIKSFDTIVICSIALLVGSLIIQISLALFGSALKRYISHPIVILNLNVISGLSIVGMGLIKML